MLTGKPTVNGGAEQLRWPVMLVVDAEEAGTRGGHKRAQLVTAKVMGALEFAGKV